MDRWHQFLDSLATRGGNILLLFVAAALLMVLVMHVLHHDSTSQTATVVTTIFSGFAGALLQALQGGGRKANGNSNGGDPAHKEA